MDLIIFGYANDFQILTRYNPKVGRIVDFVYWLRGQLLVISTPVLLVLLCPVYPLRERIQTSKSEALDELKQKRAITADAQKLRMFLESRADWPVRPSGC
jgi:hypothetical protein